MGLKFRRGTTAQKSGSLAFGEPYVNTTLGTLQIGGDTGDITLGASGTGSQGSFAGISGSSLDITGNAKIDGNLTLGGTITIGDNSSDNVVVNADLSSSIIPNNDNAFDLGSSSKRYKEIYGTDIYGAIKATNGVVSGSSQITSVGTLTSLNVSPGAITGSQVGNIIPFYFANQAAFPSAATYHGAIAHSHSDAKMYFAHGGVWNELANANGNISGSSQVTYTSISSIPAGIISGSSQLSGTSITDLTIINLTTVNQTASVVFSSGSNIFGDAGNDTHSFTGSVQVSGSLTTIGASTATSFNGTINSTNGVVSGSSQISHDSTTGFSANKHIDHTSVLISAGNGLSGGGDISSTRTLTLDSGSAHFTGGIKTKLNLDTVISGSLTGNVTSVGNATTIASGVVTSDMIVDGTIVNGDINASAAIVDTKLATISTGGKVSNSATTATNANTVSAIVARDASGNFSAGTITANLTGNASGTAATVTTAAQSAITSVGTLTSLTVTGAITANGGVTVAGAITATGDITAFFTSDIRHKNNVQLIDNALDKVNALNGVTWEWNDDVNEVTKQTPKTGLIAQDVLDVLPEVVKTREDGFLALDYSKMVGLLVEAIKEQDIVIQKLKSDMIGLSTTITVFEDRMKEKGLL